MNVILWLLSIELLGFLAFPLAFLLFGGLKDRGYAFTKPLGLLLLVLPLWLLGSLNVLPFARWSILLAMAAMGALALALALRHQKELWAFLRREWALLLAIEGVFLLFFLGWVLFRAYAPTINAYDPITEQLMDFAFLNASTEATSFPPEDPWLRGHGISYYYLGHLMMGLLTKLTGISSAVTYNLSLALVPAMAAAGVFSLVVTLVARAGASLRRAALFGLTGVMLLGVAGNLEGVLELTHARGVGSPTFWESLDIKGLGGPVANTSWYPQDGGWWWRATRVIDTVEGGGSLDYTIQEFPFFSSIIGDLHPHFMSTPFLLLFLAFGLNLLASKEAITLAWLRRNWGFILLMGLTLGALGFIDISGLPTFFGLTLSIVALKVYQDFRQAGLQESIRGALAMVLLLAALATIPYLPYYLNFNSQASGVGLVDGPVTRPLHFAILWGGFLVALMPFLLLQLNQAVMRVSRLRAMAALAMASAPLILWAVVAPWQGLAGQVPDRFAHLLPALLVSALLLYRALQEAREGRDTPLLFILVLLTFAAFLLMGPELFYVKDFFEGFGPRMNTIFKLYYQAWIVLAVASAVALYYGARLLEHSSRWVRSGSLAWLALLVVAILGGLYYTAGAPWDKTDGFRGSPTLNGLAYLEEASPGEYAAIQWLKQNARPGDGVLEAVGSDYSHFGRVAASTGLSTVLGWPSHEHQWRGTFEPLDGRAEDVLTMYSDDNPDRIRELLDKYDLRYVVVGPRERRSYGAEVLERLDGLLERIFSQDGVTIYRVRDKDA